MASNNTPTPVGSPEYYGGTITGIRVVPGRARDDGTPSGLARPTIQVEVSASVGTEKEPKAKRYVAYLHTTGNALQVVKNTLKFLGAKDFNVEHLRETLVGKAVSLKVQSQEVELDDGTVVPTADSVTILTSSPEAEASLAALGAIE